MRETSGPAGYGKQAPILPRDSVAGRAVVAVVAIMAFLAAIAIGAVRIAEIAADEWGAALSSEMTIQVKPVEGRDLDQDVQKIIAALRNVPDVSEARAYTKEESEQLLSPWLGSNLDLNALPVPRLIRLHVSERSDRSLAALRYALSQAAPAATLDDHRSFSSRLSAISGSVALLGTAILLLVLLATVLSVSFATRGAVASNRATVEVLHFVGARDSYIARIFQRHFLVVGLKGALIGGGAAGALFALARFGAGLFRYFSGDSDAAFLFGSLSLDARGYLEIAAAVIFVALVTAAGSRFTVHSTLRSID